MECAYLAEAPAIENYHERKLRTTKVLHFRMEKAQAFLQFQFKTDYEYTSFGRRLKASGKLLHLIHYRQKLITRG